MFYSSLEPAFAIDNDDSSNKDLLNERERERVDYELHVSSNSLSSHCETSAMQTFDSDETSPVKLDQSCKPNYTSDSQSQDQSNKKLKSTFPFGKCKVCSDDATGIHYGIATCEGCKVIFIFYLH